ncbi:hypothetical protein [Streptomyces griseus]|uniref:hypothetical protein n=1 Tax=Streptomyces griseus TaxID=1911 RepID=UPI0033D5A12B
MESMEIKFTEKSLEIKGQVTATEIKNELFLSIDIVFDKPQKILKNTLVLAVFDKSLQNYAIADYPYVTNFQGQEITISPSKDPKGFSVGRAIALKKDLTNEKEFVKVFQSVKFMLVYEDDSGNLQREYFISNINDFTISPELLLLWNARNPALLYVL